MDISVSNNQITNSTARGIFASLDGFGTFLFDTNSIQNAGINAPIEALRIDASTGNSCATVTSNTLTGNNSTVILGDVGIENSGTGTLCLTLQNNFAPEFGYVLTNSGAGTFTATDLIKGNVGNITTTSITPVPVCTGCP